MKCKLIIFLIMIVLIPIVGADICQSVMKPGRECTMLTPTLDCNTSYTIYNEVGVGTLGNMTLLNDSIYYFNFTQGVGSYIIQLCDNSTREMVVEEDEDTMIIGTAIIMGVIIGLFIYLGYVMSKEDNFMFYLSYLFWYIALLIPLFGIRIIADSAGLAASHAALLNSLYKIYLYLYLFMVIMLIVYMIILFMTWIYNYNKTPKWKRNLKEF